MGTDCLRTPLPIQSLAGWQIANPGAAHDEDAAAPTAGMTASPRNSSERKLYFLQLLGVSQMLLDGRQRVGGELLQRVVGAVLGILVEQVGRFAVRSDLLRGIGAIELLGFGLV